MSGWRVALLGMVVVVTALCCIPTSISSSVIHSGPTATAISTAISNATSNATATATSNAASQEGISGRPIGSKVANVTLTPSSPARQDEVVCRMVNATRYDGRLINHKSAKSAAECAGLCADDSGCGYSTFQVAVQRCLVFAYITNTTHSKKSVSYDCVSMCSSSTEEPPLPPNCTMETNIWYEGGGPKGGYASQIHGREAHMSAACSSRTSSATACAQRCFNHPTCVVYNWRVRDQACHRFTLKGGRHWGRDGEGHFAGQCHVPVTQR
eukprot:TRINITY_DN36198_c0_g1_i1.p1 TRINITY_DN36198_c0_g1~~TRINITY_DN36198_c0_g1_i1.p1  ORF type:complete len:269 (+),score=23.76 TRINITY_DN36198_c0_g1_i1:66-872(+)